MIKGTMFGQSSEDICMIFRRITAEFKQRSDLLDTQGVFRLASTDDDCKKVLSAIEQDGPLVSFDAHALANTLKYALRDKCLVDPYKKEVQEFDAALRTGKPDASCKAANALINALLESPKDRFAAEIIHTYFHLAYRVAKRSTLNQMTAQNMVIACLANFLVENLFDLKDPMMLAAFSGNANVGALASNTAFANPFAKRVMRQDTLKQIIDERSQRANAEENLLEAQQKMFALQLEALEKSSNEWQGYQAQELTWRKKLLELEELKGITRKDRKNLRIGYEENVNKFKELASQAREKTKSISAAVKKVDTLASSSRGKLHRHQASQGFWEDKFLLDFQAKPASSQTLPPVPKIPPVPLAEVLATHRNEQESSDEQPQSGRGLRKSGGK